MVAEAPSSTVEGRTPIGGIPRPVCDRRTILVLGGWYVASRVVVLIGMALTAVRDHVGWGYLFREWDASWYLYIAGHGYPSHPIPMGHWLIQGSSGLWAVAFMPGYPIVMAALRVVGLPLILAGGSISLICGFVATVGIYRLGTLCFSSEVGKRAAILFCLFPGAAVFSWVYTEGLSLALAVISLCFLLRRRWVWAGALSGLASAVHVDIALALTLACGIAAGQAVWRDRDFRALVAPVLSPLGLLAYFGYLEAHTGSWRNWLRSEQMGWHQGIDFGSREIHSLVRGLHAPLLPSSLIVVSGALLGVVFSIVLRRRPLPAPAAVMALTVLAVSFASSDVGLRPRALLAAGPAFVSLAGSLNDRETKLVALVFLVATPLLVAAYLGSPQIIP